MKKPSAENDYQQAHAELLISSYRRLTGKELINPSSSENPALTLFEAPYGVVSHGTEDDPIFNYGNQTALKAFEMTWNDFTALPSRKSAEAINREKRQLLLDQVNQYGFLDDYRGVRISASGNKFWIEDATIWNVINEQGDYCGQAAVFLPGPDLKK